MRRRMDGTGFVRSLFFFVVLVTASCGGESNENNPTPGDGVEISTEGGEVKAPDGSATLVFPADAVGDSIVATIESVDRPDGESETIAGTTFDLQPEGVEFDVPVVFEIEYDDADLRDGVDESALRIHVWEDGEWQLVEGATIDTVANVLRAELEHFSTYSPVEAPPPALSLSPQMQEFGTVPVGSTSEVADFTVENSGEVQLLALEVSISEDQGGHFSLAGDACTGADLEPGESCVVGVEFSPSVAETVSAALNVAAGNFELTASGSVRGTGQTPGELTISPTPYDFGEAVVGSVSEPASFTVTNTGEASTGSLVVELGDSADFVIPNDGCTGAPLAAGGTCTIIAHFEPLTPGEVSTSLIVSDGSAEPAEAALNGQGLAPAVLAATPSAGTFAPSPSQVSGETQTFTIENAGGAPTGALLTSVQGAGSTHFTIETAGDDCDGATLNPSDSCNIDVTFMPTAPGDHVATLEIVGVPGGTAAVALDGTALAPASLEIDPLAQSFGSVVTGQVGGPVAFTVSNIGQNDSGTLSVTLAGANAGAFSIATNTCTSVLSSGATCAVAVVCEPNTEGDKTATLDIAGNPGETVSASLTCEAIPPGQLSVDKSTVAFGDVVNGGVSTEQTIVVTNVGAAGTGTLSTALTGDFTITTDGCTGMTIDPSQTCAVGIEFAPSTVGAVSEDLVVSDPNGASVTVGLSGNSVAEFTITPSMPVPFDFGSAALDTTGTQQTFTVTNTSGDGSQARDLSVSLSGSDFTLVNTTCNGSTVSPGATCAADIAFEPTGISGTKSGQLEVTDQLGTSVNRDLQGEGLEPARLTVVQASTDFGDVLVGDTSTSTTFTVTNSGSVDTGVLTSSFAGTSAGHFAYAANACVGVVLAPAASCTIDVQFAPGARGAHSATLEVTATPGGTAAASVSGNGLAPAELSFDTAGLGFGTVDVGNNSLPRTFTLTNAGDLSTGTLSTSIGGMHPGDYSVQSDGCGGVALGAGDQCAIETVFAPTTGGAREATLDVTDQTLATSASMSGTGLSEAELTLTPAITDFGDVPLGATSAAAFFTVDNVGGQASGTLGVSLTGDSGEFVVQSNCPTELAGGTNCTVDVSCAPTGTMTGPRTATLQVSASPGGAVSATLACEAVAGAQVVVSPTPHDFQGVAVNETSAAQTFTVENVGSGTSGALSVSLSGDASHFSIVVDTCIGSPLGAGATCTVDVKFAPTSSGTFAASLDVGDGTVSASAALSGTGQTADLNISPNSANFGTVVVDESSNVMSFTITNTGELDSGVPITSLTGVDAGAFTIISNNCTTALAGGGSCTVGVACQPTSTGAKNASLSVSATPGGSDAAALSCDAS